MMRAVAILRVVVLVNALGLNLWRQGNYGRPVVGLIAIAVMVGWTAVAVAVLARDSRRTLPFLVADLAMAAGLILISPIAKGEALRATVPGFWVMGALMTWAVHWRWRGGLIAATVLAIADLSVRNEISQANYGNVFLILIGGPIVGYLCELLQVSAVDRARAERQAAAAAERTRLARAVHDGVLQVLALVQRRGAEIGGEAAELGRLAGEQESQLRALIRQQDSVSADTGPSVSGEPSTMDVAAAIGRLESRRTPRVSIALPGTAIPMPEAVGTELVAAIGACLDNVSTHVGVDATAWILVEDLGDRVLVTVRDEGGGISPGRLESAVAEGRLGVSASIIGRMSDLGGSAHLETGSYGTEWELSVPRRPAGVR